MTGLTHTAAIRQRSGRRVFARHLAEMLVAMFVLGGAVMGVLALSGSSTADAPMAVRTALIAVYMTVPMVWWMPTAATRSGTT